MYRITIENLDEPNNKPWVYDNILSWGCVSTEDVEYIEEELEVKLTEDEIKEVARRCEKADSCPDISSLRWIIQDVVDDRRFE